MKTILRICAALALGAALLLAPSSGAQAATPSSWLSVSAGFSNTCAIATNHALYCWGQNSYGSLGVGDENPRYVPTRVGTGTDWAKLTTGSFHTCAIKTSGALYCWGYNDEGAAGLGDGTSDKILTPTRVGTSTKWASVSGGEDHTCGVLTTGALYCWGFNSNGQLGLGGVAPTNLEMKPTRVGTSTGWASVSAGANHTCGRQTTGRIYCWGANGDGQLGSGAGGDKDLPVKVGTSTSWTSVSAGGTHTCARHKTGAIYCWGNGANGRLGLGADLSDRPTPKKVGTSTSWTSVDAGYEHTCARHQTGAIYCWGNGANGRLGLGDDLSDRTTPKKVGTSTKWVAVQAGGFSSCARHSSGAIYCWGANNFGQLGLNDADPRHIPTKVH